MNHTDIELILLEYETITRLKQDKKCQKRIVGIYFFDKQYISNSRL